MFHQDLFSIHNISSRDVQHTLANAYRISKREEFLRERFASDDRTSKAIANGINVVS